MVNGLTALGELVKSSLVTFRNTDFSQILLGSLGLALGAGLFILLALIYKILFGKNKFKRPFSGHVIPEGFSTGNTSKIIYLFPKFLFAVSILFMLWALANPYLPKTKIEENVESIEWIHLIDVSPSKGWPYENTKKSVAEITHEAFIKFLEMRKGQNDRCSLWYFHGAPTMVEDFIIDDDVYMMQAEDMPFVVTDPTNFFLPENDKENKVIDIIAPRDRIHMVFNGGGTDLVAALDAVIKHFDDQGDKKIKQKVLLIETDMAIDANPDAQFKELKKRKINVYILHTKPNEVGEQQGNASAKLLNAELFRKQVEQYGFKMYSVYDPKSLEKAYRDVNKLEKSPTKVVRHLLRILIYQRPLLVSVILLFLAITSGLVVEKFLGEDP